MFNQAVKFKRNLQSLGERKGHLSQELDLSWSFVLQPVCPHTHIQTMSQQRNSLFNQMTYQNKEVNNNNKNLVPNLDETL